MSGYGTTWYLEALDAHSNEVIARELSAENALRELWCSDGKKHNLWRCDHILIRRLKMSQSSLQIKVCVWRRRGLGKIESAPNFSVLKKNAARRLLLTTKARRT